MLLRRLILCGALLGAVIGSGSSSGAILSGDADGWHTWQLDEPAASTSLCCFTHTKGSTVQRSCDLDRRNRSLSNDGDCTAGPGTIKVFVHMVEGHPEDILILSAQCPVFSESAIIDHGLVSAADNVDWFRSIIENPRLSKDIREMALFALVQSNSAEAYAWLDKLLSQG
jgi:hypothetical protein